MKRTIAAVLFAFACTAAFAKPPSELSPLAFLEGRWLTVDGGGSSGGEAKFDWLLQDRVLMRKSYARYDATDSRPASTHEDLMIIHADGEKIRADYYDSEGHVIRYDVTVPKPSNAVFVSSSNEPGPRYRLSYELRDDGLMLGTFEIAPPGKEFAKYLQWTAKKGRPLSPVQPIR